MTAMRTTENIRDLVDALLKPKPVFIQQSRLAWQDSTKTKRKSAENQTTIDNAPNKKQKSQPRGVYVPPARQQGQPRGGFGGGRGNRGGGRGSFRGRGRGRN